MKRDLAKLPEGVLIRAAEKSDAPGLTTLGNMPAYRHGTLREPFQREAQIAEKLNALKSNQIFIVAEAEGRIIADAFLGRFAGRRAHAASFGIGVHDDWQGRGVGSALLASIIEAADSWLDIRRIELTVFSDNAPAVRLYEKFGFEKEGLLRGFAFRAGDYVDAFTMARMKC